MAKISLAKCMDVWSEDVIMQSVRDLLAPLGGMEAFVKKGERVLVKPNYVVPWTKDTGVITHPLVVKAVCILAKEAGASEVVIGENVGVGYDAKKAFEATGGQKVADDLGVKLFQTAKKCRTVPFANHPEITELDICEECLDVDCLINIPVIKTHMHTRVSVTIKNLKGCLPHRSMKKLHLSGVDYGLATLARILKPRLNIVDATIGQEGMGPITGGPKEANFLMAGEDAFATDVVACALMGIEVDSVRHLTYGAEVYGESLDYKDHELVGAPFEEVYNPFLPPPTGFDNVFGAHVVEKDACTGCNSALLGALSRLDKLGETGLLDDITLVVGQRVEVPESGNREKFVLVGKCTTCHKDKGDLHIPGCPPPDWAIMGDLFRLHGREEADGFFRDRIAFYEVELEEQLKGN